jgi:N-acetylglucosamine-6-phosphate deacetylase
MKLCKANILTPNGFIAGELQWSANGRLAPIAGVRVDEARVLDGRLPLVLPGFIDLHVHGGGGRDIMEGGDAIS